MQGLMDFLFIFFAMVRKRLRSAAASSEKRMAGGGGRRLRPTYCVAVLPPRRRTCGFPFRGVLQFLFGLSVAMEETVGQGDA